MKTQFLIFFLVAYAIFLGLANFAKAAPFEAECPEEIKTKQAAAAVPKGWLAHVDAVNSRHIFTGLQLFNGHPKDNAPLFPDESPAPTAASSQKGAAAPQPVSTDTTYKIPPGHEAYVVCEYTNSTVRMIQKIPKGIATCRVKFSETLGHIQKAVCE